MILYTAVTFYESSVYMLSGVECRVKSHHNPKTHPNPPQGRESLIVLMYINSPSLGEGWVFGMSINVTWVTPTPMLFRLFKAFLPCE
jgi:hypothetical protein